MSGRKPLVCVRCGEEKPHGDFVNDRTRNSGKFPWCKPCVLQSRHEKKRRDAARVVQPLPEGQAPTRVCPDCGVSLDGENANRVYCSERCKGRVRQWRIFGLEPEEYKALIASNGGKCPICRRNVKKWVLDHDHDTGETIGATCSICNQSLLAFSRHDADVARRLVEFIEKPPVRELLGEPRYVGPDSLEQMERSSGWRKKRGYSVGLAQTPYDKTSA